MKRIAIALVLIGTAFAHAPVSYELFAAGGKFIFTDVGFSQKGRPHFSCSVENQTGKCWRNVHFTVRVRTTDGVEADFSVSTSEPMMYLDRAKYNQYKIDHNYPSTGFNPNEYKLENDMLASALFDPTTLYEYKVEVHGTVEANLAEGRFTGPVFANDCLSALSHALTIPPGLERRRKLKEMVSLGCTEVVNDYKVESVGLSKIGVRQDQRPIYRVVEPVGGLSKRIGSEEYLLVTLIDEARAFEKRESSRRKAFGWIAKSDITPSLAFFDYTEPPNFRTLQNGMAQSLQVASSKDGWHSFQAVIPTKPTISGQ